VSVATPRVGVDLVDAASFEKRLGGREDALREVFTEAELTYCRAQYHPWNHLAARFAAKEATLKALGSGLAGAMRWRDVEVVRDAAGAPGLAFHGAVREALDREGLGRGEVSLSHAAGHAIAVVILLPG
jgi:holo-[acyl-carrier protein] synthase